MIGDLEEGSEPANILLRAYRQCLMQLLRGAHWDFARRQAPMVLLADATGNTPNVGTQVVTPWIYEYAYPGDCMKARFVPWNPLTNLGAPAGNITPANAAAPLMTGLNQAPLAGRQQRPARMLVATDFNYPAPAGSISWETQGVSPQGRTVVLTNVKQANLVYTALLNYPSVWDPLFRGAFVAYLASEVALPIWAKKDPKMGLAMRGQQVAIAKDKIQQARITNGNEGWQSNDIPVDWMDARNAGTGGWRGFGTPDGGPGVWGYGWDQCGFADGAAY
jgi:hypothetical protein